MKRMTHSLAYGAAVLTILFALALPIKLLPIFLSVAGSLDLKIAPWFSGGEAAFVIDRGRYQIRVYHPVYPALIGEGSKGFVRDGGLRSLHLQLSVGGGCPAPDRGPQIVLGAPR